MNTCLCLLRLKTKNSTGAVVVRKVSWARERRYSWEYLGDTLMNYCCQIPARNFWETQRCKTQSDKFERHFLQAPRIYVYIYIYIERERERDPFNAEKSRNMLTMRQRIILWLTSSGHSMNKFDLYKYPWSISLHTRFGAVFGELSETWQAKKHDPEISGLWTF